MITLVLGSLCYAQQPLAVTVRGRLLKQSTHGTYPAAHVSVMLTSAAGDATPFRRDAVTGEDGIFYFYNITRGDYILEIEAGSRFLTRSITVTQKPTDTSSAYQDIPEITLSASTP
jgi:hypothetical protein